MSRYKARHLYCSEMSSSKLWDHSLTLTYHIVIRQDTSWLLELGPQGGPPSYHAVALPAQGPRLPTWTASDPDTVAPEPRAPIPFCCWALPLGHLNGA